MERRRRKEEGIVEEEEDKAREQTEEYEQLKRGSVKEEEGQNYGDRGGGKNVTEEGRQQRKQLIRIFVQINIEEVNKKVENDNKEEEMEELSTLDDDITGYTADDDYEEERRGRTEGVG